MCVRQRHMHKAVDLFCGAGGMTTGLGDAGVHVQLGVDCDDKALSVYTSNHSHKAVHMDLSDVSRAVEHISSFTPDLLAGSPPCQEYSCAGTRVEGARADLTVSFAYIASRVRARCVLIENVSTMINSTAWGKAREILEHAGRFRILAIA